VMAVDVQIALGDDVKVNQTMTRDLIEHVVKKANASVEVGFARAVKVDADGDLGFRCVAGNSGRSW
jgi:hypothetical protein